MSTTITKRNLRILVIDDNRAIHEDFRKILRATPAKDALEEAENALFDDSTKSTAPAGRPSFEIDSAYQGQEGLELVRQAVEAGRPYAMAFVDVRMPPGWDGIETAARIWEFYPDLQVVLCTAYSDYSWDEMTAKLNRSDRLVILKKPFDTMEVLQLANALTEKWRLHQEASTKLDHLEQLVLERTQVLLQTNEKLQAEIIERRAAEDRIYEQAALLDLAHDAIFVKDWEGRIKFWSKGAEGLYGWTAAEAAGKTNSELFPGGAPGRLESAERELVEKGEWSGELRKQTKDGRKVTIDSRWTLLRDGRGKPKSVLVIEADITEKKKLETQFLRAQRMEGIGTLATGMAHDLNNILAPILISAGTMRWELSPEEREDAIKHIEGAVRRGAEVIRQVLTFGRGVEGDRVAVNPGELLVEAVNIIKQTFPKDIAITHELDADLWPIIGDKTQIHQVLLNLCINARDAMTRSGRLSLAVRKVMVDEHYQALHGPGRPGPYVAFEVMDTGCGIPASDLERIFDPFFTTKELGKGTGLGLSTVLGIVKSHNGLIAVESVVKQGTTFKALFPASSQAVKSIIPRAALPPAAEGETVLIVDDEVNIVAMNRRMLIKHGYQVLVAESGQAALDTFNKNRPRIALVVTDIMMPGMDGVGLIRALRTSSPDTKIIASSGLGSNLGNSPGGHGRAEELKSLGVNAFLPKPYTADNLLSVMHKILNGKKPASSGTAPELAPTGLRQTA